MKKVEELKGAELDYWVAKAQGKAIAIVPRTSEVDDHGCFHKIRDDYDLFMVECRGSWRVVTKWWGAGDSVFDPGRTEFNYHLDWGLCGTLITNFNVAVESVFTEDENQDGWSACAITQYHHSGNPDWNLTTQYGSTPQEAICRAVVCSVFGIEVGDVK